jgi:hypothetical protein
VSSIVEMAEAHLLNVEREIHALNERKAVIESEIGKLQQYLQEGRGTLLEASATQKAIEDNPHNQGGSTVELRKALFNPSP